MQPSPRRRGGGGLMPRARRRFGRVRQLPSGRWQARYHGPDGIDRAAPGTFERRADADRWLARIEDQVLHGDWLVPDAGLVPLKEYGPRWFAERAGLRPRTRQLYEGIFRRHIEPSLGPLALTGITPDRVSTWRAEVAGVRRRGGHGRQVLSACRDHPRRRGRRPAAQVEPVPHPWYGLRALCRAGAADHRAGPRPRRSRPRTVPAHRSAPPCASGSWPPLPARTSTRRVGWYMSGRPSSKPAGRRPSDPRRRRRAAVSLPSPRLCCRMPWLASSLTDPMQSCSRGRREPCWGAATSTTGARGGRPAGGPPP